MPPIDPQNIHRICLSRMKFIGDVVLTTPIIHAVSEQFPDAYIAYLGDAKAVSLLEHNPYLDEIIPYDFSKPDIIEQPRVMFKLRQRKFDVFVDLFSNPRSAILARASGAPIRIGKEVKGRGKLYTHRIRDNGESKTAVEFHYQYVKPLSVEQRYYRTEIFLTEDEKREAKFFLKWQDVPAERPVVGLHPGATWPAKKWEWERFADLADLLTAKLGCHVVLTQGPNDADEVRNVSKRCVGNITILPFLPLRQLAAVLSHLKVYVANDNGTMHIAAAVGTTTIGIFGPGEEDIWFPYTAPYYDSTTNHLALRKDVPCHPCHLDYCNRQGSEYMQCMKQLSVKEVFEEVKKRIDV